MLLPLLISFLAALLAAMMSYGVDPRWAEHPWGLGLIMLARRLQWPLVALSLILCLALLALVISGKRRAWWLIALAPVMALFAHRFVTDPLNRYDIADEPGFVSISQAAFVNDDDHVVGVVFNEQPYAYPYACLFETPVIVQSDRDQRLLLMWSPFANAATALAVELELKARQLDIASAPADGLLLYNSRRGEFIAAMTGRTPAGKQPAGVKSRLPVTKTTWKRWKSRFPQSRVMLPRDRSYDGSVKPLVRGTDESITLIGHDAPLALPSSAITFQPINTDADGAPVLIFRDEKTGAVRAFDRRIESDLIPQFRANSDNRRHKGAPFIDADTDSGWTRDGVAIDGASKGKKLKSVLVQEEVWSRPARYWHPQLQTRVLEN